MYEVKPLEALKFRYVFLRRPHRFGPSSTYNLTLLSNVKKRVEDWPNFCGLLRISELCYFYSVIEQMFQKVFYSGLADHKKHCKYFQLYEPFVF